MAKLTVCLVVWVIVSGCDGGKKHKTEQPVSNQTTKVASQTKKWHEGGTLHKATALAWQTAEYNNKLATCADFIARLHNKKLLKKDISFKISSVDDLRPLAEELVEGLDKAFEKNPDSLENERMFANQKVVNATTMLVDMRGWLGN